MPLGSFFYMRVQYPLVLLLALLTLTSCGGIQKAALSTTSSLIYSASREIETETDWELFKKAVPANLKFMEGLYSLGPTDKDLLVSLVKGYTGYAYAVSETLLIHEKAQGVEKGRYFYQSLRMYSKALKYGLRYLEQEGVSYKDLLKATRTQEGVPGLLAQSLSEDKKDLELVVFMGQALGALINLQRDDMKMVAQLPLSKGLFDWVCKIDPEINHGACQIFYGAYEAGRPKMLGGNPEKGDEIFQKAMERYPDNWLIRLSYLQYVIIPKKDFESYQKQKEIMSEWEDLLREHQNWQPNKKVSPPFENQGLGLYQSLALKRFQVIEENQKQFFK